MRRTNVWVARADGAGGGPDCETLKRACERASSSLAAAPRPVRASVLFSCSRLLARRLARLLVARPRLKLHFAGAPPMRRLSALALRALPLALRPTAAQGPAPAAAAAARAFVWRATSDAPPPRRALPGEHLSGVAHSTQWRVGHRHTVCAAAPAAPPAAAPRSRGASQVLVEYDTKDVDRFIALADALEARSRGAARGATSQRLRSPAQAPAHRKRSRTCRWRATSLACARGTSPAGAAGRCSSWLTRLPRQAGRL